MVGVEHNSNTKYSELKYLIMSDLYRYGGRKGIKVFLLHFFLGTGSKLMIWLRIAKYSSGRGLLYSPLFALSRYKIKSLGFKYGIEIPLQVEIGPGFHIGHFGGITLHPNTKIGRNCNITQGVTIGISLRGKVGVPAIGDNVYIGPGAVIIGGIKIGNNVAIGPNVVIGKSIKSNSIVIATPPEVLITDNPEFPMYGSRGFISHTDYEENGRPIR